MKNLKQSPFCQALSNIYKFLRTDKHGNIKSSGVLLYEIVYERHIETCSTLQFNNQSYKTWDDQSYWWGTFLIGSLQPLTDSQRPT